MRAPCSYYKRTSDVELPHLQPLPFLSSDASITTVQRRFAGTITILGMMRDRESASTSNCLSNTCLCVTNHPWDVPGSVRHLQHRLHRRKHSAKFKDSLVVFDDEPCGLLAFFLNCNAFENSLENG